MNQLFSSIFGNNQSSINPLLLLLALAVSFLLGIALSWVYQYRTLYTREFVVSLSLMPALMTLVIFFINGNLGTSIAVAGTFSLIRFRSATSGSRELTAVFISMIIGLANGMGYLLTAIFSTVLLLGLWFFLDNVQIKTDRQSRRLLAITVTKSYQIQYHIQTIINQMTNECDLISIQSLKQGQELKMVYEIDLKPKITDYQVTGHLLKQIPNLELTLTKKAKKRKNL